MQFEAVDTRSLVPVMVATMATPEPTRWWTPEIRDAVKLKEESCRASYWPVGLPDAVDGYQQSKQAAARAVLEAKTRVWEEFGRGTLDQLYTLHRVLEGLWEFAQPVHMCFVDLDKAFGRVPCLLVGYCMTGAGAWFTLPAMMLSCWLHQARTFSMYWSSSAAKCEVKWLG
ncbi:hypothetical protein L3Q82_002321 [Scortum barcoo]|uniref:Uncharacterized protein n=1 Tax=Scortum barcoo TaxID=214431 RepID=A0ACB8VXI0_9TELE|nr:hypothetical protein L3Q82_002321 [Scortum barcoo]